ncbi:hypothetical protein ACIGC1_20015 [Peribacillus butanolivorans]
MTGMFVDLYQRVINQNGCLLAYVWVGNITYPEMVLKMDWVARLIYITI